MTLLEAMNSGKKFRKKDWSKDHWMQWIDDQFIDSFGKMDELVLTGNLEFELYQEPIIFENTIKVYRSRHFKPGIILVPAKFKGKNFKIRLEEIK